MTRLKLATWLAATALASAATVARAEAPSPAPAAPPQSSPAQLPAPQGESRPNVLLWMLDDVGFAQLSSFGGIVETPNIDRVAAMGVQFSNYHTAPICSASRAAVLTGRNPHSVEMGAHALLSVPTPGYAGRIPAEAGTVAANLKASGYATLALGKWDHQPSTNVTASGPFTYWPSGQGFDRFYGFLAADADQWTPALVRDNAPIATPARPDYHLSEDLADQAITMIDEVGVGSTRRPFFMYWATGAAHAPHHAPKEWIDRYKGKFDMGWDKARDQILKRQIARGLVPAGTKLAPRPGGMPAWDSLSAEQKQLYARQMEVFAASLSHADAEFGRILDRLQASGQLDNTIVMVTSDNGASGEGAPDGNFNEDLLINGKHPGVAENMRFFDQWGGPETFPHYAVGWAVAGNTPFRYYKQIAHGGGTHVPLIVSWPKGIAARGELRSQFAYVTDIAPTVLELAGVAPAETLNNVRQRPFEGISFAYALNDAKAADRKDAQYIELFGNRSLWSGGWTIVTSHRLTPWDRDTSKPFDEPWELYDVRKDPGQATNLAKRYPEKVAELAALYDEQAKRYNVTSVNVSEALVNQMERMRAEFQRRGGVWSYSGPISLLSEGAAPPVQLLPFRATFAVTMPTGKETGPLFSVGGRLGGMGLYTNDGVAKFTFRGFDGSAVTVTAPEALPAGTSTVELIVDRQRAAPLTPLDIGITIKSNGQTLVAEKVNYAMPIAFGIAKTFAIGIDHGDTVSDDYQPAVPFAGEIGQVSFDFTPAK